MQIELAHVVLVVKVGLQAERKEVRDGIEGRDGIEKIRIGKIRSLDALFKSSSLCRSSYEIYKPD